MSTKRSIFIKFYIVVMRTPLNLKAPPLDVYKIKNITYKCEMSYK